MAAKEVVHSHGDPLMIDHTPSGANVLGGEPVVIGEYPFVPHRDIADGVLGALAAHGGVYECVADAILAEGTKVYWDASAGKITVTTDTGANKHFGFITDGTSSGADGDKVKVAHFPDGTSI